MTFTKSRSDGVAILGLNAREILDSRGNPTLEVTMSLTSGASGRASVPSGASTGRYEALELRDADGTRYGGKGVIRAVNNVNGSIARALIGNSPFDQTEIDQLLKDLDGTYNKGVIGANAILGVSLALAHTVANHNAIPLYKHLKSEQEFLLPVPMFNILNGGKHAQDSTDFQEFMVVPLGLHSFSDALRCGVEVYHALGSILARQGLSTNVGDEGGFAPSLASNKAAIELILQAIEIAGYQPGRDCLIALDVAASELFQDGRYLLAKEGISLDTGQMVQYYADLVEQYPIVSIEDGLDQDDWDGWGLLMKRIGKTTQLVGDDLFTTNPERIIRGRDDGSANAVLIKLNQIGTLTETLEAIEITKRAGWAAIISHRSGETEDTTIADLAVSSGAGQIKAGAPVRGERVAKYNRLLCIEEELEVTARYAGRDAFGVLER